MTMRGHIENGAVILDQPIPLPDGTEVRIDVAALPAPAKPEPRKPRVAGTAKGLIWMSEDFDAPLEDFKEYME